MFKGGLGFTIRACQPPKYIKTKQYKVKRLSCSGFWVHGKEKTKSISPL